MAKTRRALVTGAEGFIGSHLITYLAHKGWDVIAGALDVQSKPTPAHPRIKRVHCDLRDGRRVKSIISRYKPTHVFHLGAQSLPTLSWTDPVGTFEANVMCSLHIFEAIRHAGNKPVFVSACSSA